MSNPPAQCAPYEAYELRTALGNGEAIIYRIVLCVVQRSGVAMHISLSRRLEVFIELVMVRIPTPEYQLPPPRERRKLVGSS